MNGIPSSEANVILIGPPSMENQDCDALSICRALWQAPSGERFPILVSCFEPTDEERQAIAEGAPIYLHIIGSVMPPVMLSTQIEADVIPATN